jgi:hypothetical protein
MLANRHLIVLVSGAILGLLGGVIANTVVPEVYSGTASIKIGKIRVYPKLHGTSVRNLGRTVLKEKVAYIRSRPIERREDVEFLIREKFRVPAARLGKVSLPYIFQTDSYEGDIITFAARGRSEEEVRGKLDEVINFVKKRHNLMYDSIYKEHWRDLERILRKMNDEVMRVCGQDYQSATSPVSGECMSHKNQDQAGALFDAYAEVSLGVSAAYSERTWVLVDPVVDEEKVQPKPFANLLAGLISGIAFGFVSLGFVRLSRALTLRQ